MPLGNVERTLSVLHRLEESLLEERSESASGKLPMESRLDWHRGYAAGLAFALQLVRDEQSRAENG